jgi:ABC-type bacteriocin/lantibiotic exporter with double-glycine peptidase domain
LTKIGAYRERLSVFYEAEPEMTAHKKDPGLLHGNIELQDIRFRYEEHGPLILNQLSLKVRKGEFVAITGQSGCGKSTLLRLLVGFEIPLSGSVFFDDMDLAELDASAVRHQLGVVLQNDTLISGDIYTNICGATQLSLDAAWQAAQLAGIADEIREMPMQMHTMITNGGGTLSSGQKQRILIARVLAANPRAVFLDEATSALDNAAQDQIATVFEKLNMTRVVIAHRLSTIEKADRIYVLKEGQIAETGTYAELMRNRDYFYQLVQRQSLGY